MKIPVITSPEDNGNIIVIKANDPDNIQLNIRGDINNPVMFQWFNFYLEGEIGKYYTLHIDNASKVKFPDWNEHEPYKAYASYGHDDWFTVDTTWQPDTGKLTLEIDLQQDRVQFAFFPPYNYERHLALIEKTKLIQHCHVTSLGKTNGEEGRDITLLTFGERTDLKKNIWLIARQHPGEPQAEWYAEGLIEYLEQHSELTEQYTFYIVPNMNPDGTYHGNLRTNKEGKDLNRMWQSSTIEDSPEVYYVFEEMKKTGVDLFLDIHSDEIIPKPFLDEAHPSCPTVDERLEEKEHRFMNSYIELNSDMQNELNYGEKNRNNAVNLTIGAMAVGSHFECPSFTLEMPTKSWSIQQCKTLALDFFKVIDAFYPKPITSPGNMSFLSSPRTSIGNNSEKIEDLNQNGKNSSPQSAIFKKMC